ncbi:7-carboxy-7-deazaguanine synthase QueE [Candidatus Woesearchaeota archaeon]|nr:7-carboxy-7-deazaguanine synthase QueE [Candidatus Woesearchaeota archaeon]
MKLPISEIYSAVQGEGLHKTPAIFVRFWGCNLRCGWNQRSDGKTQCDTPYAVFEGTKRMMSAEEVVEEIKRFKLKHVVFTGGEPALFQFGLKEMITQLPSYFIEMETNGTIPIDNAVAQLIQQFNISPKLKSSNQWVGYGDKRIQYPALKTFPPEKSIFKFIITSKKDISEIREITKLFGIPVYLMPQGETRQQIVKSLPGLLELCLKHGYGFTNRDQIIAYGKKRGV